MWFFCYLLAENSNAVHELNKCTRNTINMKDIYKTPTSSQVRHFVNHQFKLRLDIRRAEMHTADYHLMFVIITQQEDPICFSEVFTHAVCQSLVTAFTNWLVEAYKSNSICTLNTHTDDYRPTHWVINITHYSQCKDVTQLFTGETISERDATSRRTVRRRLQNSASWCIYLYGKILYIACINERLNWRIDRQKKRQKQSRTHGQKICKKKFNNLWRFCWTLTMRSRL